MKISIQRFKLIIWPSSALGLFVLDRVIKYYYVRAENFFPENINTGIAFNIPVPTWLLWSMLGAVFLYIIRLLAKFIQTKKQIESTIIFALLLGTIGNIIDRLLYGGVIDYIYILDFLPIFNIADILIAGSIGLWLIMMI